MTTSTRPLWLSRPSETFPPLGGDAAYDVAVVGGGLAGLITAVLFARSGRSVVVLEAREVAGGTTGHTTAKVSTLQGTKLSRLLRRHPASTVRSYVDANLEGAAWLRRYCQDHDVPHQERTAYTYATTDEGQARAHAELEAARGAGLPVTWVDDPGLPFLTRGAVALDGQFQLHPMDLVDALVSELIEEGGVIHEWSRVTGVDRGRTGLEVATRSGTVTADHVVITTNFPILDRGVFFARCQARRSYAAALRSAWTAPGMYLSSDPEVRSIRSVPVEGEELLLVGGNGHITGRAASPAAQLGGLIDWARATFPVEETLYAWSAQDQGTITDLPFVGHLTPREDRILVATGFDKWGFTNSAAAALILSKLVLGDAPDWGDALRSWSPRQLGALPTALAFNGAVGLHLADGWFHRFPTGGSGELHEGEGRVTHDGLRPVAECVVGGQLQRVSAVCPHLGGILRWNDAENSWDCPLHGSRFAADGSVLEGPAVDDLQPVSSGR